MRTTGHDIHFLSRLNERGDEATTELALRLYRDAPLVRTIVADAKPLPLPALPGVATISLGARLRAAGIAPSPTPEDRIAIALGPADDPPHAIVARSGHFITCLAGGMRVGDIPVVPWHRAEKFLRIDDASDAFESIKRETGLVRMFKVLHLAGFRVSREEIAQFRSIAPLIWTHWANKMHSTNVEFINLINYAARISPLYADNPVAIDLWRKYHSMSHYMMLTTLGGEESMNYWFPQPERELSFFQVFFQNKIGMGDAPLAARGLYCLGQGGKHLFAAAKGALAKAKDWPYWRAAALTLLMLGARHRKFAPDAIRCLRNTPVPTQDASFQAHANLIRDMAVWAMRRQEELSEDEINGFRAAAADWCRECEDHGERSSLLVGSDGLTSLDFARRLYVNMETDMFNTDDLVRFVRGIPFLASMESPEDFYHPAAEAKVIEVGFRIEVADRLCARYRRKHTPIRVENKLGRNDPCHCRSGKKYKKCCEGEAKK